MEFIDCKTILNRNRNQDWFGAEFTVNLYRGCCHGCIYCDSRSLCYQNFNFDAVKAKKNAIEILDRELCSKQKRGVIDSGSMGDPYNPFEEELFLTRRFLELCVKHCFGVSITTKSALIERDIDLLCKISQLSPVICEITITAGSDSLSRLVEPNVNPSSRRFRAIKALAEQGIFTGVVLMPILPFIEDSEENITSILKQAHDSGAQFVFPYFGVTLRQNQREWFYGQLRKQFPQKHFDRLYSEIYGMTYECISLNKGRLKELFESTCQKYSLLYRMEDIVQAYKLKYVHNQLSFF